jgi:hypothetical protein
MAQDNIAFGLPSTSTTKGCYPTSVQKTGTITSTGTRVVGTSTLFTTELQKGDYIFNTTAATAPEVRRVKHILDNTHLILESAFTVDVSAINLNRVRPAYKSVGVANIGGADGVLNGGTLKSGVSPTIAAKDGFLVEPFSFNATGTTFNFIPSE